MGARRWVRPLLKHWAGEAAKHRGRSRSASRRGGRGLRLRICVDGPSRGRLVHTLACL